MSTPPKIPLTARAAVIDAHGQDLTLKTDHPVTQPADLKPGECLIKLEYAGCCHSDLHVRNGDWESPLIKLPLVGGHEGVGHVVAIGDHTSGSQVKVGDRVGCKWVANACLRCEMCRKGYEACCPVSYVSSHGFSKPGTFADYVVSFTDYVTPIPDSIGSAEATPILCAGVTVYKALLQSRAAIGNWVAISGAGGGLGHLAVQYAVAMGLRVVAIDTGAEKKALVTSLGAEKWVDFRESKNLIEDVKLAADGVGPHAAIIAAGSPLPFNQAIMYLRSTGTLVCVGMPGGGAMLNVPINLLIGKCLHIVGTAVGNRQEAIEALAIAALGKVKVHHAVRPLEDLNLVMNDMEAGKITGRIVLKM